MPDQLFIRWRKKKEENPLQFVIFRVSNKRAVTSAFLRDFGHWHVLKYLEYASRSPMAPPFQIDACVGCARDLLSFVCVRVHKCPPDKLDFLRLSSPARVEGL